MTAAPAWQRDARQLKVALEQALSQSGRSIVVQADKPPIQAVRRDELRDAFYQLRCADAAETKRKAFNRLLQRAQSRSLVMCWEHEGSDWIGFPPPAVSC